MLVPLVVEPDPDDADCAVLCVDGEIAGRACRFILDTGAARSQVVADGNTLRPAQAQPGVATGVFGSSPTSTAVVPEVRVGAVVAVDLEVHLVTPDHPLPRNLLGLDVLSSHSLALDFDRGTVTFDEPAPERAVPQPLQLGDHSHPHVDVRWGDVTGRAVWDTGAGMTIVSTDFWRAHPELFTWTGTTTGTDANGQQQETPTYVVHGCDIAGLPFRSHPIAVVDLAQMGATGIDLILGYTTMCQANWHVDFPRRTWACWPRNDAVR